MAKALDAARSPLVAAAESSFSAEESAHIASGGESSIGDPAPSVTSAPEPQQTEAPVTQAAVVETTPPVTEQKMVPHGALHEERERRKAAEQRLVTLEERTNVLLQKFNAPAPTPAPTAAPLPDPEKDPAGFMSGVLQQFGGDLQALKGFVQQTQDQQEAARAQATLAARAQAGESEFMSRTPDYMEAVRHLLSVRNNQLFHMGYKDPAERAALLQQEKQAIAARAAELDVNPAEMVYGLAQSIGYQPKAPDATQPPATQPPAASAAPAQMTEAERLERIKKGQGQAMSLGSTNGTGPVPLTAQRLLEMTPDQFAEVMKTAEGRAAMGS